MNTFSITRGFRAYAGKVQTLRNQKRTERLLESMPSDLRKDLGWPDRFRDAAFRWSIELEPAWMHGRAETNS